MKGKNFTMDKIRLALVTVVAMQLMYLFFLFTFYVSSVSSKLESVQKFQDIDFTNISFLDTIARRAMKRLHDDLDHDDDGNVSLSEGAKFINREDFHSGSANLPGFATDKDGRITEEEFWESWVHSAVHNWTVDEMAHWLSVDVDLPQHAEKFKLYGISGAAMPILACNSSLVLSLVEGAKEHKLKLWLKAMEVVLCGYTRSKSSLLKDALLTISIGLALGGVVYAIHVRRTAFSAMTAMQQKLNNLQSEMSKLDEEEARMESFASDDSGESSLTKQELNSSQSSLLSDSEHQTKLQELLEELADARMMLEQAEERLNDRKWCPPSRLISCLKKTQKVELKLHEAKRVQAQKKVEQAKARFGKISKKTSIFTSVQFIHSRQVDSFDLEIQTAKDFLREVQLDSHDYRKRWLELEKICNTSFISSQPVKVSSNEKARLLGPKPKLAVNHTSKATTDTDQMDVGSSLNNNYDGLQMKDLSVKNHKNDASVRLGSQRSCPTFSQQKVHSQEYRHNSEPTSDSTAHHLSAKLSLNHKSIAEVEEVSDSEKSQTFPRKRASPRMGRRGDSVQSCVLKGQDVDKKLIRDRSPDRTISLGPGDLACLPLPPRKSLSSHSMPDLTVDPENESSNQCSDKFVNRSLTSDDNSKSVKKRSNFGSLFRRKKGSKRNVD